MPFAFLSLGINGPLGRAVERLEEVGTNFFLFCLFYQGGFLPTKKEMGKKGTILGDLVGVVLFPLCSIVFFKHLPFSLGFLAFYDFAKLGLAPCDQPPRPLPVHPGQVLLRQKGAAARVRTSRAAAKVCERVGRPNGARPFV